MLRPVSVSKTQPLSDKLKPYKPLSGENPEATSNQEPLQHTRIGTIALNPEPFTGALIGADIVLFKGTLKGSLNPNSKSQMFVRVALPWRPGLPRLKTAAPPGFIAPRLGAAWGFRVIF